MTIDKIGTGNNIHPTHHIRKVEKPTTVQQSDRIDISADKRERVELENIVKAAPDIRADKVAEAKANLERYMKDDKVFDEVARRVIRSLVE